MPQTSNPTTTILAGAILLLACTISRADEVSLEADPSPEPEVKLETDDQQDLRRLDTIWAGNLSEIRTAHIQHRSLLRAVKKKISRDEVVKLLESCDFVGRPDDVRMLSEALGLGLQPDHAAWGNSEFYLADNNRKVNRNYEGKPSSEEFWTDSLYIRFFPPNSQIDIRWRKDNRNVLKTLADFRYIPRTGVAATIEKRSSGEVLIKVGYKEFVVEQDTGFVHSAREFTPVGSKEIIHKGRVAYPDDIIFPAAVIACRYSLGGLETIAIDVIESATFNEPIKDEVFAISAPVGSKVFDDRLSRDDRGHFTKMVEPVPDVLSEIDKRQAAQNAGAK